MTGRPKTEDRVRALAEWAGMLARWTVCDDGDRLAIVEAVQPDASALVADALLETANGLGARMLIRDEHDAPYGSESAPWIPVRTFALHTHAARVVGLSRGDLLRVALGNDAARLLSGAS